MNNEELEIVDKESRKDIVENIDENYFVEAGAGSGKTTTLVNRMVKMIAEGRKIEHICAITFTKAAANEFYDRFQSRLNEKILENDENKEKYLEALHNIDLAFMGTIDAFCNMVMSEHPNEGLIPTSARIIDEEKAQELYEREYTNILNGKYNDNILEEKSKLFIKYDSSPKDTFILTLQELLSNRDCELVIPTLNIENIDNKFDDEIKTIRKIVDVLDSHPEFIYSKDEDKADVIRKAIKNNKYIFDGKWDNNTPNISKAFKNTFFSGLKKETKVSDLKLYFADDVREQLREGVDYFNSHNDKYYEINYDKLSFAVKYIEKVKYVTTLDFVNYAKTAVLSVLRKEGYLTFNDYLIYLRDTLKDDAKKDGKLIKHIYDRHRYFLIDEFQDTDPIQAEIFFYLAAKEIKENWKDCIPHKGSLFIVGDPKQSIYRFKSADIASYLNVEKLFNNPNVGKVLHLYNNFRSTKELREWFNLAFTELLPETTRNQVEYVNIPIAQDDIYHGEFSNVYKYDVPYRAKADDKDEIKVANILLKIHDNQDFLIVEKKKDKNKKEYIEKRVIDWNDIMIITPSKPSLSNYTKTFREKGIPYFVEGNINFNESEAFVALIDYFSAVINPIDNRYLYKILKSDIYHTSEKELSEARRNDYKFNVLSEIGELKISKKLMNALNELKEFATLAKQMCSSSLISKIIEKIELFRIFGNENMEYVYFALELVKSKEINGEITNHNDTYNFLISLLSKGNSQERCPKFQASNNVVHLANLHKVKGLEKPVVILAHPNSSNREPSFRIVREKTGNKGYLFNVSRKSENGSYKIINTDMYDDSYKKEEQESINAENTRLEYVAATRAKNVLIISNQTTKDGIAKANPWKDLLSCTASKNLNDIELVLANANKKEKPISYIQYDSVEKATNNLKTNESILCQSSYELCNPSKTVSNSEIIDIDITDRQQKQVNENNGDTLATIIGTMVHRLMELIITLKDKTKQDEIVNFVVKENITKEFVDKKQYFIDILNNVYITMHNGGYSQKGKVTQDILPLVLKADKVYSEVPFTYKKEKELWNGIIDLIYEKDGKFHIIDWKTNKDDTNLDDHYKGQLEAYINAAKQKLNVNIKDALIYHICIK